MTWHVAMRPEKHKALLKTTEGELLEKIEHTKVSNRAKVEHPFHLVKNLFLHRKVRYKGLAKKTVQLFYCSVWLIGCWLAGGYLP